MTGSVVSDLVVAAGTGIEVGDKRDGLGAADHQPTQMLDTAKAEQRCAQAAVRTAQRDGLMGRRGGLRR